MAELSFKDQVFAFLSEHPGNLAAAAKEFGKSRAQIAEMVSRFPERLKEITESHLDELEEQVYLSARGKSREDFRMNEALKLLSIKRPKDWGGKVVKGDDPLPLPPNLAGTEYVLEGNREAFVKREVRPKQTVIRVDDAPGGFFEDTVSGGVGQLDQGNSDAGYGLSCDGDSDI